ncbi:unnamed protein product [Leuciscus chuanchicus]
MHRPLGDSTLLYSPLLFCDVDCNVSMCPPSDKKCGVGYLPDLIVPNGKCCPEIRCGEHSNCVLMKNVTRLHVNNCTSIEYVEVTSCTGHCDTKSMYSMEKNIMMHSCSCCREETLKNQTVTLKCANSNEIPHNYTYVESCTCTPTECVDQKNSG